MIPKFNKQIGRWGVWHNALSGWVSVSGIWPDDSGRYEPLRFQSKQEAAARIKSLREAE